MNVSDTYPKPLLTVDEVAGALAISPAQITALAEAGELPAVRVGVAPCAPLRIPAAVLDPGSFRVVAV